MRRNEISRPFHKRRQMLFLENSPEFHVRLPVADAIVQGMTTAIERIDELRAAYARPPSVRDGAAEAAEAIAELIAFRPGRSP